jgi:hypothetical protein
MNWRDRVSAIYANLPPGLETRPAFRAAASSAQVADLESKIGGALPPALADLLLQPPSACCSWPRATWKAKKSNPNRSDLSARTIRNLGTVDHHRSIVPVF